MTNPSEFYAQRGFKRIAVTLRPATIEQLNAKGDELGANSDVKCTHGDVIEAMMIVLNKSSTFANEVDTELKNLLANKANSAKKAGRKPSPNSEVKKMLGDASEEQLAEIQKILSPSQK